MFWYGENTARRPADFRPEVHDSDGLFIEARSQPDGAGQGEAQGVHLADRRFDTLAVLGRDLQRSAISAAQHDRLHRTPGLEPHHHLVERRDLFGEPNRDVPSVEREQDVAGREAGASGR